MVAEYEGNVNSKLCALLVKAGLNAEKEVSLGRRARADILVRFENHSVAVECEKAGPGKDAGAIKDASSRLSPTPYVAVAFAVVYPQGCSESALTRSTRIRMAKVTRPFANRRARHVQSTIDGASVEAHDVVMPPAFHTCTVDELATMLKNTGKDLGDPKSLVDTLNDTLHSIVSGLTENQMRAIGMSMRLSPDMRGSWRPAARRALLVIAAASMFHRRLDDHLGEMRPDVDARSGKPFKGSWPPMSLSKCQASQSTVPDLSGAWHEILAVDYKAIFTVGRRVLDSSDSLQFTDGVREIIRWARSATGTPGGLRHDVLGRIFHKLLADAKYDGSFYTSIPASILLAGLAIKSRRDLPRHLKDMKVIDPACGTGTLLMASAERMRDVMGGGYDPRVIIENVLTGIDINTTALHMAATTLGLLSPTTMFTKMDMRLATLGRTSDGGISAGSLELYGKSGTFPICDITDAVGARQVETNETKPSVSYSGTADLVIMNPPFTRDDLRHDQLGDEVEELVKKREADLFKSSDIKVDKSSSGPMFLMLGAHLAKRCGTLAFVFPMSFVAAPSASDVRKYLAKHFYVEYVVVSHDPRRVYFSENTEISEILVVLSGGKKQKGPTRIVNLAENPSTAADAARLVNDIRSGRTRAPSYVSKVSRRMIVRGDWSAMLFFSRHLYNAFQKIKMGKMFPVTTLDTVASINPRGGRAIRDYFKLVDTPSDPDGRKSIWRIQSDKIATIQNIPTQHIGVKNNQVTKAANAWASRGMLLLPERLRLNLTRITAVCSSEPTVSPAMVSVLPVFPGMRDADQARPEFSQNDKEWSQAMAVYFNSTVGIISLLGARIPKTFSYPRFSISGFNEMRVPKMTSAKIMELVDVYKEYACKIMGRLTDDENKERMALDDKVSSILEINTGRGGMNTLRRELSREPMCTDKRYGDVVS